MPRYLARPGFLRAFFRGALLFCTRTLLGLAGATTPLRIASAAPVGLICMRCVLLNSTIFFSTPGPNLSAPFPAVIDSREPSTSSDSQRVTVLSSMRHSPKLRHMESLPAIPLWANAFGGAAQSAFMFILNKTFSVSVRTVQPYHKQITNKSRRVEVGQERGFLISFGFDLRSSAPCNFMFPFFDLQSSTKDIRCRSCGDAAVAAAAAAAAPAAAPAAAALLRLVIFIELHAAFNVKDTAFTFGTLVTAADVHLRVKCR